MRVPKKGMYFATVRYYIFIGRTSHSLPCVPVAFLLTLSRPPSEVGQRPGLWRAWRLIVQEELHDVLDTFRQSGAAVQDGSLAVDGRTAA